VAPNICYEDLFGEELAARFADPASAPTMLANLSNIGWFGQTIAVDQHLQISRLRSLELQRPMLRATNTGATVVIDHRGVVRFWLEPHTRGVLEARVQGRDGNTPFATWAARFGLWPLALLALAAALLLMRRRVGP
jgi:apolipoprotein N-acyltransferase